MLSDWLEQAHSSIQPIPADPIRSRIDSEPMEEHMDMANERGFVAQIEQSPDGRPRARRRYNPRRGHRGRLTNLQLLGQDLRLAIGGLSSAIERLRDLERLEPSARRSEREAVIATLFGSVRSSWRLVEKACGREGPIRNSVTR